MAQFPPSKGPWAVVPAPHKERGQYDKPRWRIGANGGRIPIIDGYVINEEDAVLMAAAPELLAVAQYAEAILADVFNGTIDPVMALDAISDLAKPAIAKATQP